MAAIDFIREGDGDRQLDALASQFGLSRTETEAVVESLVPQITRRIE